MITGVYEYNNTPEAIDDLEIFFAGFLAWTAPGDDGDGIYGDGNYVNKAKSFKYDIRYSTVPITESNWDSAINLTGEAIPSEPGKNETMNVSQLSTGIYYFAIKNLDEKGNSSGLSYIVMGNITGIDYTTEPNKIPEVRDGTTGEYIDIIAGFTQLSAN